METSHLRTVCGLALLTVEISNIVATSVITFSLAMAFDMTHVRGSPIGPYALAQALLAGSGMIMWVVVSFRVIFWRWTGAYEEQLSVLGSIFLGVSTLWAAVMLGFSANYKDMEDELLVQGRLNGLKMINQVAASILLCSCVIGHFLLLALGKSVCKVLREFAPSFGMFYE